MLCLLGRNTAATYLPGHHGPPSHTTSREPPPSKFYESKVRKSSSLENVKRWADEPGNFDVIGLTFVALLPPRKLEALLLRGSARTSGGRFEEVDVRANSLKSSQDGVPNELGG